MPVELVNFSTGISTGQLLVPLNNFSAAEPAKAALLWFGSFSGADAHIGMGFGASSTARGAIANTVRDGGGQSISGRRQYNNCILARVNQTGATTQQRYDLNGFGVNGDELDLQVVSSVGPALDVVGLVFGGSSVQANVISWDVLAQTGIQNITGVGFQGTFGISLMVDTVHTPGSEEGGTAALFNVAMYDDKGNANVIYQGDRNGQTIMQPITGIAPDKAYNLDTVATSPRGSADFAGWTADGFDLDFDIAVTPAGRTVVTLVLDGIDAQAIRQLAPLLPITNSQTLSITPELVLNFNNAGTSGLTQQRGAFTIGSSDGTANFLTGYTNEAAIGTANVQLTSDNTQSTQSLNQATGAAFESASNTFTGQDINYDWSIAAQRAEVIAVAFGDLGAPANKKGTAAFAIDDYASGDATFVPPVMGGALAVVIDDYAAGSGLSVHLPTAALAIDDYAAGSGLIIDLASAAFSIDDYAAGSGTPSQQAVCGIQIDDYAAGSGGLVWCVSCLMFSELETAGDGTITAGAFNGQAFITTDDYAAGDGVALQQFKATAQVVVDDYAAGSAIREFTAAAGLDIDDYATGDGVFSPPGVNLATANLAVDDYATGAAISVYPGVLPIVVDDYALGDAVFVFGVFKATLTCVISDYATGSGTTGALGSASLIIDDYALGDSASLHFATAALAIDDYATGHANTEERIVPADRVFAPTRSRNFATFRDRLFSPIP